MLDLYFIITFILAVILFLYTLFKWMIGQYSFPVLAVTVVGCLITLGGFGMFPFNIVLMIIVFAIPFLINFLNNRAIKAMVQEDYDTCYRLIKRNPTNAAAFAKLGNLLENDKKYKDALEAYENSLKADNTQKDIDRRYQALVEKVALEESGQMRCPGCYTIVPMEYGKCWKCERIYNRQQYILSFIKKKGSRGIIALSLSGFTLLLTIFILIATLNRLFDSYMAFSISLTLALTSSLITYSIYRKKE